MRISTRIGCWYCEQPATHTVDHPLFGRRFVCDPHGEQREAGQTIAIDTEEPQAKPSGFRRLWAHWGDWFAAIGAMTIISATMMPGAHELISFAAEQEDGSHAYGPLFGFAALIIFLIIIVTGNPFTFSNRRD